MTDRFLTTGYTDGDVDTNPSTEPTLEMLAAERYSRRQTLFGGLGATSMALFGTTMLSAWCRGRDQRRSCRDADRHHLVGRRVGRLDPDQR
jgi:uncharacterized protein